MKENIRNDFVHASILFPIYKIFITCAATILREGTFLATYTMEFLGNKF